MSSPSAPPAPAPQPSLGHSIIPALTKLQQILSQLGEDNFSIDLPQVVAIGSQGSGKSSVVESLVGRDFLPRGVKTRRPVLIQLVRKIGEDEWSEFDHVIGKKFYHFEEIKKEIQVRLTLSLLLCLVLVPKYTSFSVIPSVQIYALKVHNSSKNK